MTNEEMIAWAKFPGTPDADFNVVGYYEAMNRLIWIAQLKAKQEAWKAMHNHAVANMDILELTSYPGGFKAKGLKGMGNDQKK